MRYLLFILAAICLSKLSLAGESNDLALLTEKLLDLARTEMKYAKYVEPPKIIFSTENQLRELYCPKEKCNVSAVYVGGLIYVNEKIDIKNDVDVSVIYHELIHHVQKHQFGATYDCDLWWKKEKQAYALQKKFLKSIKSELDFISESFLASLKCPQ